MKSKIILIILVVVVIGGVFGVVWVNKHGRLKLGDGAKNNPFPHGAPITTPDRYNTQTLDSSKLPPGIPSDLPIESGAVLTQNTETSDSAGGTRQSERTYITTKKIDENFTAFKKYIADKKWQTLATLDQPNYKNITVNTGAGSMSFILNYHSGTANNLVSIFYNYSPVSTQPSVPTN